jgi:hypothetical protein
MISYRIELYEFGAKTEAVFINVQFFLRFLDITLRVLRLEVSVLDFVKHREGGMVFYQVFLLSPLQCIVVKQ